MDTHRGRPGLKRAAFIVVAAVVAPLVAAEALLRIHNPIQSRVRGDQIVLVTDKTYRIRNVTVPRLPDTITIHVNRLGFRGPDAPEPFDRFLTLLTIGGSTTQSFFLSDGLTWTDRLGERLARSFTRTWINSAGLDGHSTFGHLALLRGLVVPLKPKVAIFLVGLNDVDHTDLSPYELETVRAGVSTRSLRSFAKSIAAHSEVASTALNVARSYQAHQRGLLHRPIDVRGRELIDVAPADLERYVQRFDNAALKGYEQRLQAIVETARSASIEPVLVTQPMLLGAGFDDVTGVDLARVHANGPRQNGAMYWRPLELYNDVTRRVAARDGVLLVDLAHELPKSSRYFYDFTHFTVEGSERVAEIIASGITPWMRQRFPAFVK